MSQPTEPQQLVWVWWTPPNGGQAHCLGQLVEATADRMTVSLEGERPAAELLPAGHELGVQFTTASGLARVPARLHAYDPATGLLVAVVSGPPGYRERRRFARVAVTLPAIAATVLGADGQPRGRVRVRLCDLSAGGARFICPGALRALDQVQLVLPLDERESVAPVLTVLECHAEAPAGGATGPGGYIVRGAFTTLTAEDQQRLADFVTRRQVAELRSFL
jgi:PilZ domain-containing protein